MLKELHSCSKFKVTKGLKWKVKERGRGSALGGWEPVNANYHRKKARCPKDWSRLVQAYINPEILPCDGWVLAVFLVGRLMLENSITTSIGWAFNGFFRFVWKTSTGYLINSVGNILLCFHLADKMLPQTATRSHTLKGGTSSRIIWNWRLSPLVKYCQFLMLSL